MEQWGCGGRSGGTNGGWADEKTHHEEGRVHYSSGRRYDLTAPSVEGLLSNDSIQDLKLDIPNGCRETIVMTTWFRQEKPKGTLKIADFQAYAHHTEVPPWCPTGSPEQCCLWPSPAAPCPPAEVKPQKDSVQRLFRLPTFCLSLQRFFHLESTDSPQMAACHPRGC